MYLSPLDFSNLPLLLFHFFFPVAPSLFSILTGKPKKHSHNDFWFLKPLLLRKPCLAPEGQIDGVCLDLLVKLFSTATIIGTRAAVVNFVHAPLEFGTWS